MKVCTKCGVEKALDAFYRKPANRGGGPESRCKECTCKRTNEWRAENIEKMRAHDRERNHRPDRVEAREKWNASERGKVFNGARHKKWCLDYPERAAARNAVNNAIKAGKMSRLPCFICGSNDVQGHHPDYSAPLDVVWLCVPHHKAAHALIEEIKEGEQA
jgi:hypothetical protein